MRKSGKSTLKVVAKYEKGEITLAKIRNALINDITEKGYHRTNVSEIVKKAGLTRGAFYNYWESLDACLIDLLNHLEDGKIHPPPENPAHTNHISRTAAALQEIMTLILKKKWKAGFLLLALLQEKEFVSKELQQRVKQSFEKNEKYWTDLINKDKENKIISEKIPSEVAAMTLSSLIGSILHFSSVKMPEFQSRQEAALVFYMNSIFTDSVRKKYPLKSICKE